MGTVRVGFFLGGDRPGGNCPEGNCPWGEVVWGELSGGELSGGGFNGHRWMLLCCRLFSHLRIVSLFFKVILVFFK